MDDGCILSSNSKNYMKIIVTKLGTVTTSKKGNKEIELGKST